MTFGIWQIVLTVLVVVLVFGAGKIPRVMGDFAKGIKSFKAGMKDGEIGDTKTPSATADAADKSQADTKAINVDEVADSAVKAKRDEAEKS